MPTRRRKKESAAPATNMENTKTIADLLERIRSDDADVRTAAWLDAGALGAAAVEPLAAVARGEPMEVGRAAKRGLWQIVRQSGRPGADAERAAVSSALMGLLSDAQPAVLRREVLWMLSEIGGEDRVAAIASLMSNAELREDACMALERIPGRVSLDALKSALDTAPDAFKPNIAESLRRRGEDVPGVPSEKLTPVKPTDVTPL